MVQEQKSVPFPLSKVFKKKKKELLNANSITLLNSALHFKGTNYLSSLSVWFYVKMLYYSFFLKGKDIKMLLCTFYATIWGNSC